MLSTEEITLLRLKLGSSLIREDSHSSSVYMNRMKENIAKNDHLEKEGGEDQSSSVNGRLRTHAWGICLRRK